MILPWTAFGMLEAELNFRKVARYHSVLKLDTSLRTSNATIACGGDDRGQPA